MNAYIAFYDNKKTNIYADSLYEAKLYALDYFKPPKSKQHLVHVMLAQVNERDIIHAFD